MVGIHGFGDFLVGVCQAMRSNASAITLFIGGLLAMISLRNSDLATRSRNLVQEYLYSTEKLDAESCRYRHACIRKQHATLSQRYKDLSKSFNLLVTALCIYVLGLVIASPSSADGPSPFAWVGGLLGLFALAFSGVAVLGLCSEFYRGPQTLSWDGETLASIHIVGAVKQPTKPTVSAEAKSDEGDRHGASAAAMAPLEQQRKETI